MLAGLALARFAGPPAAAQNCTQTLSLHTGWNAIQVLVRPDNNTIGHVFTNLPVEDVLGDNQTVIFTVPPSNASPGFYRGRVELRGL